MSRKITLFLTPSEAAFADFHFFTFNPLPLSLGILQGYLRSRGYDVRSVDLNTRMHRFAASPDAGTWLPLYDKDLILRHLNQGAPTGMEEVLDHFARESGHAEGDIVGIHTGANMSFFEIHLALLLGRKIKEETGKTVVFGGTNLDFLWQFREAFRELWSAIFRNFEYVFIGPGERSFADLIAGSPYRELPGAVYRENGRIIRNPLAAPMLPRPDFRGLDQDFYTLCVDQSSPAGVERNLTHFYRWPIALGPRVSESNRRVLPPGAKKETLFIPYIFNYNCTYRCAFCVQSREDKSPVASRDARSVVDDLAALTAEYDSQYVRFYNNAFNLSPSFVREFCTLVIERGLSFYWSDCARFNNLTEEMVDLLYRAGCRKLVFGLDTASPKIAKLIDKQLDLEQVRRVLRWCHERGIWAEVEIIVGLPYETEEDFQETYVFLQENIAKGYITGFHLNRYFVIPSSLLGSKPENYGIRLHSSPDGYAEMLQRSAQILTTLTAPQDQATVPPYPYQLWRYSELNGRTIEQLQAETEDKFGRMRKLMPKVPRFP